MFDMCYGQPRDMWPPPALCVCVCVGGSCLRHEFVHTHTNAMRWERGGLTGLSPCDIFEPDSVVVSYTSTGGLEQFTVLCHVILWVSETIRTEIQFHYVTGKRSDSVFAA